MRVVYSAFAVSSESGSPLDVGQQLSIGIIKATEGLKLRSATIVGWPFLLFKLEDTQGFLCFDETANLSVNVKKTILQDYNRVIDRLSSIDSDHEFIETISKIPWGEVKGDENIAIRGLIPYDITSVINKPSPQLPLLVLKRNIDIYQVQAEIDDIKRISQTIDNEIRNIGNTIDRIKAVGEIFAGKLAKYQNNVEEKFMKLISAERSGLDKVVSSFKVDLYRQVKEKSEDYIKKIVEMEGVISRAELDYRSGKITKGPLNALLQSKSKLYEEYNKSLEQVKEPYFSKVDLIINKIKELDDRRQQEINEIKHKIENIRKNVDWVISNLERLKESKRSELAFITDMSRRTIY
ncbi:hypothetical protein, partial [Acidianus sp. RZ1]|uniref:hypothetical protein n=1 Tax=Acidianus sp. RZ1 TaxID=1540082 RepID=UPI00149227E6